MNAPAGMVAEAPVQKRRLPKVVVAVGAALLIGAGGTVWIRTPGKSESTDNAYLRADSTTVSARTSGTVVALLVRENQQVKAGDPLVRIDPEESDSRLAAARADVADADAAVAAAHAALTAFAADRRVAAADVGVAATTISAADAEQRRADADDARYRALVQDGFASRRDAERIAATAASARSELAKSRASLVATRERAAATDSKQATLTADLARAEAAAAKARAALELARQASSYTLVRAAVGGTVSNRLTKLGDLVQPGTQLLTIMPDQSLYLVANFKETQTGRMLVGQRVDIWVDALDGQRLHGRVESIAPASGSEAALLPFEPGSGNFTKIVQRVPVRIALEDRAGLPAALRSGLSATVRVRVVR